MKFNRFTLLIISLCILLAGCTRDPVEILPADGAAMVSIDFTVDIPMANIPAVGTRSLTEYEERILRTVDLLFFEVNDNQVESFAYRTHNTNDLTADGGQQQTIRAMVKVDDTRKYRLVILANLREEVDQVLATANVGDPKEDILRQIIFTHDERWPSKDYGSNAYRAIPMWGEATTVTSVNKNTTASHFGTISLLKAMALIQVAVNLTDENSPGSVSNGLDFFEIEEIKVYNSHREGYAVPLAEAQSASHAVRYPSIVSQARISASEMTYVLNDINPYHENALYNTIYVNECVNAGQAMDDALFLIVKGYYTEPGATVRNTTTATWYRIDFYDKASDHPDADRIDILRNHSYLVNINYIGGPGEVDEETAKKTLPVQMKADIIGWSDGQTTDVAWNGMYMLGVSQSDFHLNNFGHAGQMFTVITNYPKGWTARVESADSWITLHSHSSFTGTNRQDPFYFDVTDNTGKPERSGYIILNADNLELRVKVSQSDDEFTIEIVDFYNVPVTERVFYSPKPDDSPVVPAQLFIVRWSPSDKVVLVSEEVLTNNAFEFRANNGIVHGEILPVGGVRYYTIAPPDFTDEELAVDPFLEKASRFYFTLGDEHPHTTNITLRHLIYNLLTDQADQYPIDGGLHSFNVRSNTTWRAAVTSDPNGILDPANPIVNTSGGNDKDGEQFLFRMADNNQGSRQGGTAIITFTYDIEDGRTRTRSVEINAAATGSGIVPRYGEPSNCYLLKPGGQAVRIPVRQANMDGTTRIGSSTALDWELVWTDHPNGIDVRGDGASAVVRVELDGTGADAELVVYGGSEAGNAVVAVKNSSGTRLWSWHIWVTDFDPDASDTYTFRNMTFMDRNLGSLVDDEDSGMRGFRDPNFWGLFYQWGRKDPFPQALSLSSNSFRPIYDAAGNPVDIEVVQISNASGKTNLGYSIENPTHYITMQWSNSDWYTSDWGLINDNLWYNGNVSTKTAYDPCPEGWRVPVCNNTASSPWNTLKDQGRTLTYHPEVHVLESSELGYWPLGGLINRNDINNFMFVGKVGVYWSAFPYSGTMTSVASYWYGEPIAERPNSSSAPHVEYTSATSRVSGCSVRCARID